MTSVPPRDPTPVTLSVPYINQSALFNVSYPKLPETFSLTSDTQPLSSELSPRITPLKSSQITPSASKPAGVHGNRSTFRDSSARASGRRLTLLKEKREQIGKREKYVVLLPGVTRLGCFLSEGYSAEGSSVDSNGDGQDLCGASWQHS